MGCLETAQRREVEFTSGTVYASFGVPRRLFDRANYFLRFSSSYDVSLDGKRFLMIQRGPGAVPRQLNVILGWSAGLKQ